MRAQLAHCSGAWRIARVHVAVAPRRWPGATRREYEYPIPVHEANEILDDLCARGRIEKWRHWVPHAGHEWEGLMGGDCVFELMHEFIRTGSARELDISCVGKITRPPFATTLPPTRVEAMYAPESFAELPHERLRIAP